MFKPFLAAACVIAGCWNPAHAGCYPSLASSMAENMAQGGATREQIINALVDEGLAENSTKCAYQLKGYARQMRDLKPANYWLWFGN